MCPTDVNASTKKIVPPHHNQQQINDECYLHSEALLLNKKGLFNLLLYLLCFCPSTIFQSPQSDGLFARGQD